MRGAARWISVGSIVGLALTSVLAAQEPPPIEAGVLSVPLTGHSAATEADVSVHYRGVPDDGLILRDNVHGEPSAFVDNWPKLVEQDGKEIRRSIEVDGRETVVSLDLPGSGEPSRWVLDPDGWVLKGHEG